MKFLKIEDTVSVALSRDPTASEPMVVLGDPTDPAQGIFNPREIPTDLAYRMGRHLMLTGMLAEFGQRTATLFQELLADPRLGIAPVLQAEFSEMFVQGMMNRVMPLSDGMEDAESKNRTVIEGSPMAEAGRKGRERWERDNDPGNKAVASMEAWVEGD